MFFFFLNEFLVFGRFGRFWFEFWDISTFDSWFGRFEFLAFDVGFVFLGLVG